VSRRRLVDALTALASRSFPAARRGDARVVRDCARDAIDGGGLRVLLRECLALAGAGLRVRARVAAHDVWHGPWRAALSVLALPLAAALLCLWTFGFVPRYDHWPLGEGWIMLLGGSLAAVIGAAFRSRRLTALGAAAVAHPVAWVMHGYRVWPHILVPVTVATALVLRAAAASAIESSPHDLRQGRRPREARE
jgi:hypothetical protein